RRRQIPVRVPVCEDPRLVRSPEGAAPGDDGYPHQGRAHFSVRQAAYHLLLWPRRPGVRTGVRDRPPVGLSRPRDDPAGNRGQRLYRARHADFHLRRGAPWRDARSSGRLRVVSNAWCEPAAHTTYLDIHQAHRAERTMPTHPLPASKLAATATTPHAPDDLDAFYADMARLQLEGLWRLGDEVQAVRPRVAAQPYLWRGADVRHILTRAGDLVRHEGAAERRTLRLVNPGLAAQHCATHTMAASVQLIRPGEVAPTHRHTPAAIRFIIQGHGAY